MSLVAKIFPHSQQICGLAWSPNGKLFASGGNDNLCCLFDVDRVLDGNRDAVDSAREATRSTEAYPPAAADLEGQRRIPEQLGHLAPIRSSAMATAGGFEARTVRTSTESIRNLGPGSERHRWMHGAAVKAIAFCPWRDGLVATGGGSNDKCIHFFHTASGSALASIAVSAQVTSLIWSTTRREIAATFGYAQPEHPYRIAIFSWPDCGQVAAIPWDGELRALYAISYPWGPLDSRGSRRSRPAHEGCIVVASSDESVKFHEVWSNDERTAVGGAGILGGSDILEGFEGIDKEGDIIR